jgi:antitoxin (DNA-binding transcriptional repressor) of toxin-antitoxin stability system
VIARGGVPVAELIPHTPVGVNRRGGQWKGKARIEADFDAPMPELEELFGT